MTQSDITEPLDPIEALLEKFLGNHRSGDNVSIDEYLEPLYIGHHTPRGNFFFAWAIKDWLVGQLDPRPIPYC